MKMLANKCYNQAVQNSRDNLFKKIYQAVEEGYLGIEWDRFLPEETIKGLQEDGFYVKENKKTEPGYYLISWDKRVNG